MARLSDIDTGLVRLVSSWKRHEHDLEKWRRDYERVCN